MATFREHGEKMEKRIQALLAMEGLTGIPTNYEDFMQLDQWMRNLIGNNTPLVLSDNYEHFMACLPGKKYAAQQVIIRKQIGGFTVASGFWKWLEFLSQRITRERVELVADYMSGRHNGFTRQFNKDYWLHVVDDFDGYLPLRIKYVGEGAVFTGVPFPVAEVYGETPAVWLNEPMYIQIGQTSHVATIAAQFAEVLGDPWRFIEVGFRALQNKEFSTDMLLAMLIGGGIISTSNDLGAFVNGAPFKPSGTTGHCFYQQYRDLMEALRALLSSELGPFCTVLLDVYDHKHGFKQLMKLILEEGLPAPFAERPDSGETLKLGMHDLTALQDTGREMNVVFEDGYKPADTLKAEKVRMQYGLSEKRSLFGAGSAFLGARNALETAYKASHFHNGTPEAPTDIIDTMKICLDDPDKQSLSGRVWWFQNQSTGIYQMGRKGEMTPEAHDRSGRVLYDGLTNPGQPYFDPDYDPNNLTQCPAIHNGIAESKRVRQLLGPRFTLDIGPNKNRIGMTMALRALRKQIRETALQEIEKPI